jgi:hypothetical protein
MKKTLYFLTVMMVLLIVLTGCGENTENPLTDEEAKEIIRNARTIESYFTATTVPEDKNADSLLIGDNIYYLVSSESKYQTYNELKDALKEVFTEQTAEGYLGTDLYKEHEGKLYVKPTVYKEFVDWSKMELNVEKVNTDGSIEYMVNVPTIESLKQYYTGINGEKYYIVIQKDLKISNFQYVAEY